MHEPPTGNQAGQHRCAEPIEQLADYDQGMQANEDGRFQDHRQRHGHPDTKREPQMSGDAGAEECDIEPNNQGEQTGDADGGHDVQESGRDVAARAFGSPGVGRFALIAMKDNAHPKPGRERRDHACDKARDDGGAQCIHSTNRRGD